MPHKSSPLVPLKISNRPQASSKRIVSGVPSPSRSRVASPRRGSASWVLIPVRGRLTVEAVPSSAVNVACRKLPASGPSENVTRKTLPPTVPLTTRSLPLSPMGRSVGTRESRLHRKATVSVAFAGGFCPTGMLMSTRSLPAMRLPGLSGSSIISNPWSRKPVPAWTRSPFPSRMKLPARVKAGPDPPFTVKKPSPSMAMSLLDPVL